MSDTSRIELIEKERERLEKEREQSEEERKRKKLESLPYRLSRYLNCMISHDLVSEDCRGELFEQGVRYWGSKGLKSLRELEKELSRDSDDAHQQNMYDLAERSSEIFAESWKSLCTPEGGQETYERWLNGHLESGGNIDHLRDRESGRIFFVPKTDIVLTPLHGSRVGRYKYIVVPEDKSVRGNCGHMTICHMDGFRKEGTVELFSDIG